MFTPRLCGGVYLEYKRGDIMNIIADSLSMMMESDSSSGVEVISQSDWDNMTTAQKQAKGLVAIQDASTGYERGVLVNGADYGVSLISTSNSILAEAFCDDYTAGSTSWDNFTLSSALTVNQDGTLSTDENKVIYYDLGNTDSDSTLYLVAKHKDAMHHNVEILCSMSNRPAAGEESYFGVVNTEYPNPRFYRGSPNDYTRFKYETIDSWHVYALALHKGTSTDDRFVDCRIDNIAGVKSYYVTRGQYAIIGGYTINTDYCCNLDIKYAAITDGYDGSNICTNIKTIMDYFGITG